MAWGFADYLADQIKDFLNGLAFAEPFEAERRHGHPDWSPDEGEIDNLRVVVIPTACSQKRITHDGEFREEHQIQVGLAKKLLSDDPDESDNYIKTVEEISMELRRHDFEFPPAVCIEVNFEKTWPTYDSEVRAENNIFLAVIVFTYLRLDES